MNEHWARLANVDDIPVGEMRSYLMDGGVVAIANVDGTFYAFADKCEHMGIALSDGVLENDVVVCTVHKWRYCLRTAALEHPKPGKPFTTFPVNVEGGEIWVRRWPETVYER